MRPLRRPEEVVRQSRLPEEEEVRPRSLTKKEGPQSLKKEDGTRRLTKEKRPTRRPTKMHQSAHQWKVPASLVP